LEEAISLLSRLQAHRRRVRSVGTTAGIRATTRATPSKRARPATRKTARSAARTSVIPSRTLEEIDAGRNGLNADL